jgi:hypothetical protein
MDDYDCGDPVRRYLWTDAFAVCNFLTLYRRTNEARWLQYAFFLVEQVHNVLGRQHADSNGKGWISGLSEKRGKRRPTAGGLRIGKKIKERSPEDPYDPQAEWDRDGQYYHYLVKWMFALNLVGGYTKYPNYIEHAIELAKSAHAAFVYTLPGGLKRMYWKMSTDLSYPLVKSMGQHDPLDGLIIYRLIQENGFKNFGMTGSELKNEISDMKSMCDGMNWVTADSLGLGGLMSNACYLLQLILKKTCTDIALLNNLLLCSYEGLRIFVESGTLNLPAEYRLAFRELGLAIGLKGIDKIKLLINDCPDLFSDNQILPQIVNEFKPYIKIAVEIEEFWLNPENRQSVTWIDHPDINSIMLATSVAPDSYLGF